MEIAYKCTWHIASIICVSCYCCHYIVVAILEIQYLTSITPQSTKGLKDEIMASQNLLLRSSVLWNRINTTDVSLQKLEELRCGKWGLQAGQ